MTDQTESALIPTEDTTAVSASSYVSPTISRLPSNRRPKPTTVCESCPAAVWHTTKDDTRNYCRVMHVIVYSRDEQNSLPACDGREMALAAMEAGVPM